MTGRTRVAVVFGGRSAEHSISCVSAGNVMRALDPDRYDVVPVGITRDGAWVLAPDDPDALQLRAGQLPEVTDGSAVVLSGDPSARGLLLLDAIDGPSVLGSVDVVFPVLHGSYGEDGTIQGLLEMTGLPYVGAGVFASAAAMDKVFTKKLLAAEGIRVGEYAVPGRDGRLSPADRDRLGLPVFVKPARAGSSIGISKVQHWADLDAAVDTARAIDDKVLVEAAISGREIECGVLEGVDGGPTQASVCGEIRMVGADHEWYDFQAKYLEDGCELDVPADLPEQASDQLRALACAAFDTLSGAGLARVDFFLTADGPVVNEINTMPGFTEISMFPRLWQATGLGYPELMDRLIASALRRHRAR